METKTFLKGVLDGKSSLFGAILWMFWVSLGISLLFAWIPVIGPLLGPIAGGVIGGRRAGTVGRALLAAIIPAVLASIAILLLGFAAAGVADVPVLGALGALVAGVVWLYLIVHNIVLFIAAAAGGFSRRMWETIPE